MKQRILLPVLLLIAVIGTSCVSQHNVERNYSDLKPDVVRLELTMDDYQYMGDVNIEVEYKTYLGIFSKILTVNGEKYDPRFYHKTNIAFRKKVKLGKLKLALHKVLELYPNADYIIPASFNDQVEHMMGGRIHKRTMTLKVYAINKVSATQAEQMHKAEVQALDNKNAALNQQVEALQAELNATKEALEKAELEARINEQKNNKNRRR